MTYQLDDDFNRADGALGSNWTDVQHSLVIDTNEVRGSTLSGNHLQVSSISGSVGDDQFAEVDCKLGYGGAYNNPMGPAICITSNGAGLASHYNVRISGDNAYVRVKDSVVTPVDVNYGELIATGYKSGGWSAGFHTVSLRKVGDDVTLAIDDEDIISVEDTTLTGGKPGMVVETNNGAPPYARLDNFRGGDYVPDTTPPELVSATIPSAGTTLVLVYDSAVSGAEETGWSITASGGAVTASSGTGTGTTTHTLTLSRTIDYGEVITIDYEDGTGDLADAADNDLLDIADFDVDNNSAVNTPFAPVMNVASATVEMESTNKFHITGSATGYPIPEFTLEGPDADLFELECPIHYPVYNYDTSTYDNIAFYDQYALKFLGDPDEAPDPDANADGTYEVTVKATNSEDEASTNYSLVLTTASTSPTPELPRVRVNTALPDGWDGTADVSGNLTASQLADAFAAVNQNRGVPYIIQLTKGTSRALSIAQGMLHNKTGSDWLIIRSSGYLDLPEYGDRTDPDVDSANYATIKSTGTDPAIWAEFAAHKIRFIGIEIASDYASLAATAYNLVDIGRKVDTDTPPTSLNQIPRDIIFDRCHVHGHPTGNLRRAFALDGINCAIIGCHVSECHEVGADSQAIASYNTPGPLRIYNNHLEGAGENVIIGGSGPSIKYVVPSDIEICGNYFYKPTTWKADHDDYADIAWSVKNLLELKQGERVLIEGNVFDGCWPMAQVGFAILFTVRTSDLRALWSIVNDVTCRYNEFKNVARCIDILSSDAGDTFSSYGWYSRRVMRISVENNLGIIDRTNWGGVDTNFPQLFSNGGRPTEFITYSHNTFVSVTSTSTCIMAIGDTPLVANHFICQDNIFDHGFYGINGSGQGAGTITLNHYFADYDVDHNAIYFPPSHPNPGDYDDAYPAGNDILDGQADVGFVDYDGTNDGNYSLTALSDYHNAGTDGFDLGYDKAAFDLAIATALSGDGEGDEPPPESGDSSSAFGPAFAPSFTTALEFNVSRYILKRRRQNGRE